MYFQRIHIELTNNCNFSCQFCPDSLMTRERGKINFGLLCKALDEISQERLTELVLFHVMGEPTLYSDLDKAVGYAKSKGLKVYLTTNGSAMTPELLDSLLRLNIDHILFSVQTPDERSFGLRRANIKFQEYKDRITSFVSSILKSNKGANVTISFLTTPFKWLILPSKQFNTISNKKKLSESINSWITDILEHLGGNLEAKEIKSRVNKLHRLIMRANLLGWNKFKVTNKFSIDARPIGDWIHPALFSDKMHKAKIGCCEGLREHFGILWNGDLVFCCVDFDGKTAFGNIGKSTIKEAFKNQKALNAIEGFRKFRIINPYCQKCLGDVSFTTSAARQVGSIFYFKWYRKHWLSNINAEKAELHA